MDCMIAESTTGRIAPAIEGADPETGTYKVAGRICSGSLPVEDPLVVVEPAESAVLGGGEAGPHKIEGVGIGSTPPLWEPSLVDEIIPVATADAKAMTQRLAREEALFAGTSSGANVVAAIRVAERLGPDATVVTLMCDSGLKYLSTDVYRS